MESLIRKRRENQAVAGSLEALLLVAMMVVVIGIIQTQYVPQIMRQREAEHMDQISNQFSYLKAMIDIQELTGTMETEVPFRDIPIISQITLGSRELPYLVSAPAFGEIHIENSGRIDSLPSIPGEINGVYFSSIVYHAYNIEFPEQTYVLEGGGIILNQSEGETMRADPSISIKKEEGVIKIVFYLPNFVSVPGKTQSSGLEGCLIRTNYLKYDPCIPNDIPIGGYIVILSKYPNAWNESFQRRFRDVMYDIGDTPTPENKTVDISIVSHSGIAAVMIKPLKHPIRLELKVVDIEVQIGKGWVYD